tara:strand:+ start:806 stop:1627 length:822 start_codon:yes stop_codon:yes gene_type:complete
MIIPRITQNKTESNNEGSEPFNYYISWFQSGASGRVPIAELPTDVTNPSNIVFVYETGNFINWDSEEVPSGGQSSSGKYGYDTLLFNRLATNLGEPVNVVKHAIGGTAVKFATNTGNGDWNIASTQIFDNYPILRQRIINAENYIRQVLGKTPNLLAILTDGGETDSLQSDKDTFKTDFINVINGFKSLATWTNEPITIHRELGLNQNGVNQWMIDAQNEFANNDSQNGGIDDYYLIPNTGFTLLDTVHLDAQSVNSQANQALVILENQLSTL